MIYERVPGEIFETARGKAIGRIQLIEELENKALKRFKNGEIDNKQYEFLVNFLNERKDSLYYRESS